MHLETLVAQLKADGFNFEPIIEDGKWRKVKDGNFRGSYGTRILQHGILVTVRSWDGTFQKTYTSTELNGSAGEAQEFIQTHIKEHDRAKQEINEAVAIKSQELWEASVKGDASLSPYLIRKNITDICGARLDAETNTVLRIKCQDIHGKIWGLQQIFASGDKKFTKGQKKEGTFHLIGEIKDILFIAEGFATAASVFLATNIATACAFDAGNLIKVAKAFREKYPHLKIIIAGDNDEKLTGQHAAEAAAKEVGGLFLYPSSQGKDWNDCLVEKGENFLKKIFADFLKKIETFQSKFVDDFQIKTAKQARITTQLTPDWIVENFFSRESISLLSADPKAGKSTLVRFLAKCIVDEEHFLGQKCKKSKVLMLAVEEKDRFIVAQNIKMDLKNEDDYLFHTATTPTEAIKKAEKLIPIYKPDFIIFDTMFKILQPEDENQYAQVTKCISQVANLAYSYKVHILCVHHNNKGSGVGFNKILGSAGIRGSFDYNILIEADSKEIEADPTGAKRFIVTEGREGIFLSKTALNFDSERKTFTLGDSFKAYQKSKDMEFILSRFQEVGEPRTKTGWREAAKGDKHERDMWVKRAIDEKYLVENGEKKKGYPLFVWNPNRVTQGDNF